MINVYIMLHSGQMDSFNKMAVFYQLVEHLWLKGNLRHRVALFPRVINMNVKEDVFARSQGNEPISQSKFGKLQN